MVTTHNTSQGPSNSGSGTFCSLIGKFSFFKKQEEQKETRKEEQEVTRKMEHNERRKEKLAEVKLTNAEIARERFKKNREIIGKESVLKSLLMTGTGISMG
jgi:hypothetical protein